VTQTTLIHYFTLFATYSEQRIRLIIVIDRLRSNSITNVLLFFLNLVTAPSEISNDTLSNLCLNRSTSTTASSATTIAPTEPQGSITVSSTSVPPPSTRSTPGVSRRNLPIRKLAGKSHRRGKRGKALRNNPLNNLGFLKACPERSIKQNYLLNYHKRVLRVLRGHRTADKKGLQTDDLNCKICDTLSNSQDQLRTHFQSKKHKLAVWKLTPKYCKHCRIYSGFATPELWNSHISSSAHIKKAGNKVPGEYGFPN